MKKAKAEFHHKKDGPSGKTNLIKDLIKTYLSKNDKNPNADLRPIFVW